MNNALPQVPRENIGTASLAKPETTPSLELLRGAISRGQIMSAVSQMTGALVRAAQRNRVGLVHAAMRLQNPQERIRCVNALVDLGVDLDAHDTTRKSPIHDAVDAYDLGGIDLLIKVGANIDVQDGQGHTALHLCAINGRISPATKLISAGAALSVRDDNGRRFMEIGCKSFAEHIDLFLDVRRTIRLLDGALRGSDSDPTSGGSKLARSPSAETSGEMMAYFADDQTICGD